METYEDYMKRLVTEGYIDERGYPLKCIKCGHTKFHHANFIQEGVITVEYDIQCNNCEEVNARWSYGVNMQA